MKLKKLEENFVLLFSDKETNVIKDIINKSGASMNQIQKVLSKDDLIMKLNDPLAKNLLVEKLKEQLEEE